jgi:hypothetical protein
MRAVLRCLILGTSLPCLAVLPCLIALRCLRILMMSMRTFLRTVHILSLHVRHQIQHLKHKTKNTHMGCRGSEGRVSRC